MNFPKGLLGIPEETPEKPPVNISMGILVEFSKGTSEDIHALFGGGIFEVNYVKIFILTSVGIPLWDIAEKKSLRSLQNIS